MLRAGDRSRCCKWLEAMAFRLAAASFASAWFVASAKGLA
jgi:hypothetical protein